MNRTQTANDARGAHSLRRLVGRHSTATLYHASNLDVLPEIRNACERISRELEGALV